ncbi:MAG: ABC transporter permease [Caldilineaceae bacterium SB0675_bin_29]|uniref:ABC transporter permease n=1 Tax=Caldilineaceae bacterium SB0675_bin_29 TaxID=2605266 RepID=A0A6B1G5I0_9CHLR|nr:ABC transporter permease [Caldilineaceae bacterium SB0675_bin_29]
MFYIRLFATYMRIGILGELEYRANFWISLVQSALDLCVALGGLAVVFNHTDTLGGWRQDELLALVGVYFLIGGLIRTIIRPSMTKFMEDVRQGTLDFALTKPADSQVLVSIQSVEIWRLVDVLIALPVLGIALLRLGARLGLVDTAVFAITLLCGGLIIYSFWLMLSTSAFWFVKVENIQVIFMSMWQAGRWPVSIYPAWLRAVLTFLVPVAFATTVPASAVSGRISDATLVGTVALAAAMLVVSRWFWRVGIRFYSGASA